MLVFPMVSRLDLHSYLAMCIVIAINHKPRKGTRDEPPTLDHRPKGLHHSPGHPTARHCPHEKRDLDNRIVDVTKTMRLLSADFILRIQTVDTECESLRERGNRHGIVPRTHEFETTIVLTTTESEHSMNLRDLRLKRGLTQAQLAKRAGVHVVNVTQFETGARDLRTASFDTALRLADALHVANPRKLLDSERQVKS